VNACKALHVTSHCRIGGRKRNFKLHLSIHYNSVIACIQNTDSILIIGPGEAKNELKAHMEEKKLRSKITVVEPVGFI
jgi:stalled ribosome rescue protein Dom34